MQVPLQALSTRLRPWRPGTRPVPVLPVSTAPAPLAHIPRERMWPVLSVIPSLERFRGVVYAGPAIWQLEPTVYRTCRARSLPVAAGNPKNLPVTAELARQLSPSLIIVADTDAQQLAELFPQRTLEGSFTVIVRQLGEQPGIGFPHASYGHMHVLEVLPGYPVAYSCPVSHKQPWHLFDEYSWTSGASAGIASDPALPWDDELTLPFGVTKKETCTCGAVSVELTDPGV